MSSAVFEDYRSTARERAAFRFLMGFSLSMIPCGILIPSSLAEKYWLLLMVICSVVGGLIAVRMCQSKAWRRISIFEEAVELARDGQCLTVPANEVLLAWPIQSFKYPEGFVWRKLILITQNDSFLVKLEPTAVPGAVSCMQKTLDDCAIIQLDGHLSLPTNLNRRSLSGLRIAFWRQCIWDVVIISCLLIPGIVLVIHGSAEPDFLSSLSGNAIGKLSIGFLVGFGVLAHAGTRALRYFKYRAIISRSIQD